MNKLTEILQFINEYWFLIIAAIAFISVVAIKIYKWCKQPSSEQLRQVQEWLLYAVAQAEKTLGSGTGELKLRYVYDQFMTKFTAIALFISFDDFSIMVEKALEKFEELLKENESVGALFDAEKGDESDE